MSGQLLVDCSAVCIAQWERRRARRKAFPDQLEKAQSQLAEINEKQAPLRARWENEKAAMEQMKQFQQEIDRKQVELEQAQRQGNWELAAKIQYGELRDLRQKLLDAETNLRELTRSGKALVKEEVGSEEIAQVVSRWTGVPVSRMLEGEREKLLHMEERLGKPAAANSPGKKPVALTA